jgi:hypothetical protein
MILTTIKKITTIISAFPVIPFGYINPSSVLNFSQYGGSSVNDEQIAFKTLSGIISPRYVLSLIITAGQNAEPIYFHLFASSFRILLSSFV